MKVKSYDNNKLIITFVLFTIDFLIFIPCFIVFNYEVIIPKLKQKIKNYYDMSMNIIQFEFTYKYDTSDNTDSKHKYYNKAFIFYYIGLSILIISNIIIFIFFKNEYKKEMGTFKLKNITGLLFIPLLLMVIYFFSINIIFPYLIMTFNKIIKYKIKEVIPIKL